MSRLTYENRDYEVRPGESVLEALLRQGQSPPFSCRNGSCLVCLMRCVKGTPTEASQRSLRPRLRQAGYFLPCKCKPVEDIEVAPPRAADLFSPAVVVGKKRLSHDVLQLTLEPTTALYYHAGQFVNLRREDGLTRSYSLASLPAEDPYLDVHIKRNPHGAFSNWAFDELKEGEELGFQGPLGTCYYVPGSHSQNLLLVANGTGAGPLLGVLRDALHVRHGGKIKLVFGSRTPAGLYLHETFQQMARAHPQLEYVPCVSQPGGASGFVSGRANVVARNLCRDLSGWHVFTAGHPELVSATERWALERGANARDIHSDAFSLKQTDKVSSPPSRASVPPSPEPGMWEALDEGRKLNEILKDFYSRVFNDALLSPYFRGVTMERVIGQVFSFMRDWLTGQKSYFGAQPRSAHHWMVISDEIFDYREKLMQSCLEAHGLTENYVRAWRRYEEWFRSDIVKERPEKLVVNGAEMPLEGFGELTLTAGTMCDACQRAVEVGERVRYHMRLGTTYCSQCALPSTP